MTKPPLLQLEQGCCFRQHSRNECQNSKMRCGSKEKRFAFFHVDWFVGRTISAPWLIHIIQVYFIQADPQVIGMVCGILGIHNTENVFPVVL